MRKQVFVPIESGDVGFTYEDEYEEEMADSLRLHTVEEMVKMNYIPDEMDLSFDIYTRDEKGRLKNYNSYSSLFNLKYTRSGQLYDMLYIYTEGNRKAWDDTKNDMPQEWTVGIDADGILQHELYDLPAMPIIYLLSKNKTVLLKDPTPEVLEAYLSTQIVH